MVRVLSCLLALSCLLVSKADASDESTPQYLGSNVCTGCHAEQAKAWSDSHHAWALRSASPEFVLANFEDAVFEHLGVRTRFIRRGGAYFVETEGPDGKLAEGMTKELGRRYWSATTILAGKKAYSLLHFLGPHSALLHSLSGKT